jgi:hypothetical protein
MKNTTTQHIKQENDTTPALFVSHSERRVSVRAARRFCCAAAAPPPSRAEERGSPDKTACTSDKHIDTNKKEENVITGSTFLPAPRPQSAAAAHL